MKHEETANEAALALADANECRIELLTALHGLMSQIESTLGSFGSDTEARKQAEGAVKHAMRVSWRWNWNGPWRSRRERGLCPECGIGEWDRVDYERGRERDVPFNRCYNDHEWEAE